LTIASEDKNELSHNALSLLTNLFRLRSFRELEQLTQMNTKTPIYLILCCPNEKVINEMLSNDSKKVHSIYVLASDININYNNIHIFTNEDPLMFRLIANIASRYRLLGDHAIDMGQRKKARAYFESGIDIQQKLVVYLKNQLLKTPVN
jgi:hypothetical protein